MEDIVIAEGLLRRSERAFGDTNTELNATVLALQSIASAQIAQAKLLQKIFDKLSETVTVSDGNDAVRVVIQELEP